MLFGLLALLLALLLVCSFTPGFFFIRRLRWTPREKLCGSVGLSLILVYLAAWAIYCFGPQEARLPFLDRSRCRSTARRCRMARRVAPVPLLPYPPGARRRRIPDPVGSDDAGDDPRLFRRRLVQRLVRALPPVGLLSAPATTACHNLSLLFVAGPPPDDECVERLLPRAHRRPLRALPGDLQVSEHCSVPPCPLAASRRSATRVGAVCCRSSSWWLSIPWSW